MSLARSLLFGWVVAFSSSIATPAIAQTPAPLRVIRVSPTADAGPFATITVTFDRPVAGSLDRTVDAKSILRIVPEVRGTLEWRDPVTIRLTPTAPLVAGTTYAVTVANGFRAMDGSALSEPYRFGFRAEGPRLVGSSPVGPGMRGRFMGPKQNFQLVYSTPVDLAQLSGATYLEFSAACGGRRIVRLHAQSQRRIRDDDANVLRDAGVDERHPAVDSLRRVVVLTPDTILPRGCPGDLVAPNEVETPAAHGTARWPLATYGDFRIDSLRCDDMPNCPVGPLRVTFTNPVRGAEVLRHVHIIPEAKFAIPDTLAESDSWVLEAGLKLHTSYAVVVDTSIRDTFGQGLRGNPAAGYRTTGYSPTIIYPYGHLLVERVGFRTLAVQHVNVDALNAKVVPVPDSLEATVLSRYGSTSRDTMWNRLMRAAPVQRIPLRTVADRGMITGLRLPVGDARQARTPTLYAVRVGGRVSGRDTLGDGPLALVQVTNLGVHAQIGAADGVVWVTGVNDGLPRMGATVVLHDSRGRPTASAITDATGIARLAHGRVPRAGSDTGSRRRDFDGFVTATLGDDRAVTAITDYDPDLGPWRFNIASAWGDERLPLAGAVFTERGIYRPGEQVHAKAILRDGALGDLRAAAPSDSIRWIFHDREDGVLRKRTTALSLFGTADESLAVPAGAPVGEYRVDVQAKRRGAWLTVASANYQVAEYRPPEFLVDMAGPTGATFPGDVFAATVQARYLFGAPMGRAVVAWTAIQTPAYPWELEIPGVDGWYIGETSAWWMTSSEPSGNVFASGTDTLDARGERALHVTLPRENNGNASRVTVAATVIDVNRQLVGASASGIVHPADFYIAAKPAGTDYFWRAGTPQTVNVFAVRPSGERVAGVAVRGTVVRREWHQVRRVRDGISELVGDWVSDTVAHCTVTTASTTAGACAFTPNAGGEYTVSFNATDAHGRAARTSFERWAAGAGWVPWSDETQFKMDVIPDKPRYSVGDTATVLFASPFTNAEAWVTVEREGLIEQRRLRITAGSTTLKFPITEAYAPNAFVSIVVARGRSAAPKPRDDPGRPTIRVGYAELRITPEVKRLAVHVEPVKSLYRPAENGQVALQVRDAQGRGARSEVTLWAVDEGVLALTGYKTPDPIDLIYRERGLGMRLASNMTSVAPQTPEGEKGKREAGGGGGVTGSEILRSRFQSTAFFLGSVVTDAQGNATATAKLPDNLTTFRVMAVAVTAGDRYGKGESKLLVTRPLLARPSLPRFVRPGDEFLAGAVINRRDGRATPVTVKATVAGITLKGDAEQKATLQAQRGTEVRFPFQATRTDSASFRFDVNGDGDADAVRVTLPVRPDHHPRAQTIAGVLRDSASVELALPPGTDLARSRLSLSLGVSPIATIKGMTQALRVYPYDCSEQVVSSAAPLIALIRAQQVLGSASPEDARRQIARAVDVLSRRQRSDGGIGYWSPTDWSTAWLSAYAGGILLDARDVGVKVDTAVLSRLSDYLTRVLHGDTTVALAPISDVYRTRDLRLREQVAAADFLSRAGHPDVAAENELLRTAAQLTLEDRARLAEVFMRRKQATVARTLMASTWRLVKVEGRRAVLPDSGVPHFYFASRMRPVARMLTATLAIDPANALIGPLVETLVLQERATRGSFVWNTQDYAAAVVALAAFERSQRTHAPRSVTARTGDRVLLTTGSTGTSRDSTIALTGLVTGTPDAPSIRVSLNAGAGDSPVYYYLTLTDVPVAPPVTPDDRGMQVERWYESYTDGKPLTRVNEGDVVRVRLRITVPSTRQFVVLDDALPAGLEATDLSLRTSAVLPGPGIKEPADHEEEEDAPAPSWMNYGHWDSGWWSPFDHQEIRDDRVVYSATILWPGTYTATYLARATTAGTFIKPPAYAEEMYNPGLNGRSDGGTFVVVPKKP